MKLARLLLHAFGPFTDAAIDFTAVPVGLHLVYGPNEAGKSSALRAITDLRFGIPVRSPDNFVHAYGDLRISGVFVDEDGEQIGLCRRKGRGRTLSGFDPTIGAEQPLLPEHERALTGGLERGEFEAMFGLDHTRLREGGRRLLQGEGELGSALFEASAGTRGIAALLTALDDDAKQLFNPHGRSRNAIINAARHELDEQRRAWREAQIRPAEWQTLHRNHDTAREALREITERLEALRRQDGELAELRTVQPLLREHDRLVEELESLAEIPDLPETARDQRLAAEHALSSADKDWREAEADLKRCAEALEALVIEPAILDHGAAIERLCAGIEPAAQARVEVRRLAAAIVPLEDELAEHAARIASGRTVRELLAALPSAADRVALDQHLDRVERLSDRLEQHRQQATELEQALTEETQDRTEPPDLAALHELDTALAAAREPGDVRRQQNELDQQLAQWQSRFDQALIDLNVASIDTLRSARPLLEAQIAETRDALAGIDETLRGNHDEDQRLQRDLEARRIEQRQLMVAGEVATTTTLKDARRQRDAVWIAIRRAYVERNADPEELAEEFGHPLPETFEQTQRKADHQADLLHNNAERAAKLSVCEERIDQMETRRRELETERGTLEKQREDLLAAWSRRLADANLPDLSPEALTEWQRQRSRILELAESSTALQDKRERLLADAATALSALSAALQAMGQSIAESDEPASRLRTLIARAERCAEQTRQAEAADRERRKAEQRQRAEQARLVQKIADTETERQEHLSALRAWHERLALPPDSAPNSVKARLAELDRLERLDRELGEARRSQARQQAYCDELDHQATRLAEQLGKAAPELLESFAECLHRRLSDSREAEQKREHLLDEQRRAQARKHQAQTEHAAQTSILEQLCAAAGVESIDTLPALEGTAAHKRALRQALDQQRERIGQASTRPEAELRHCLADRDTVALDAERERCRSDIQQLEEQQSAARRTEEEARRNLAAIDTSDRAAAAREAMESAAARYRESIRPWARLRLAHALLTEARNRFRDKAQAPMVAAASEYFALMTGGRYTRLVAGEADGQPLLRAERLDSRHIGVAEMSEGTADQLYLALRLAALRLRRESHPPMPLVLDDVLVTSDDERAGCILQALARYAEDDQVLLFTHHKHLIEVAHATLGDGAMGVHVLDSPA